MLEKNFLLVVALSDISFDRPIGELCARMMLVHIGRQTATPSVLAYLPSIKPKRTFVAARKGCCPRTYVDS